MKITYLKFLKLKFDQFIEREASQLRPKRKAFNFYRTKENRFENRENRETHAWKSHVKKRG